MHVNARRLHRIDVTEVQIAIIIIYLMSAFGGVGLWQNTVTRVTEDLPCARTFIFFQCTVHRF